jgi:hypothetical protein
MTVETIAGIATAIGVALGALQLYFNRRQERAEFEDELAREYRQLCQRLPPEALLGIQCAEQDVHASLANFLHYFLLTNDQVFLRQRGRITRKTWNDWRAGIASNLARPAFATSWLYIKEHSKNSFEELRALEASAFRVDPRRWGPPYSWFAGRSGKRNP